MNVWTNGWVNRWVDELIDEWISEWTNGWVNGLMDEWINEQSNRWMNGLMDEWTDYIHMYLISAASDKNLFCSSTVAPFFNVLTATGVGPVLCPKISIAVPWYTSPNSPRSMKLNR